MSEQESPPKVLWEIDSTHPEEATRIRQACKEVVDPEMGLNVVELGLVRQVAVQDGQAHIRMILTTPFCPYGPALLEMTRSKIEQAAGLPARIELSPEPWDPGMMEDSAAADWGFF